MVYRGPGESGCPWVLDEVMTLTYEVWEPLTESGAIHHAGLVIRTSVGCEPRADVGPAWRIPAP